MRDLTKLGRALVCGALVAASISSVFGFAPLESHWQVPSIELRMQLGPADVPLRDGSKSWDAAAENALALWNEQLAGFQFTWKEYPVGTPAAFNDTDENGARINSVTFSNTIYGDKFGSGTLAVTLIDNSGSQTLETDVIFNAIWHYDSFRGTDGYFNGTPHEDIHRVALHEFGHVLGLDHPDQHGQVTPKGQPVPIMNSQVSNSDSTDHPVSDTLQADDISGAQAFYGAAPNAPTPTGNGHLAQLSTRGQVGTGDAVLIGGFIIQGSAPKKMIIRAIGPSLSARGISGALADPTLDLYDGSGALLQSNDDWQSSQQQEIIATSVAPTNPKESAVVANLSPGAYTAIVRGTSQTTGLALVELYDLETSSGKLANISTRGAVGNADNALIGGFIITGAQNKQITVRALGPSLASGPSHVEGALSNPTLEVRNANGQLMRSNDDWPSFQGAIYGNLYPKNTAESAIGVDVIPDSYTTIVYGANGATGIGLVEIYGVQ